MRAVLRSLLAGLLWLMPARAAEQLHAVGGDFHRHVTGEALGGGAEEGEVVGLALGARGSGVDELAGGLELHAHVGEHELHALEVGDGAAELAAIDESMRRIADDREVGLIEPRRWLCVDGYCPPVVGNLLVYRDQSHLSATFVSWMTPLVSIEIVDAVKAIVSGG